MSYRWSFRLLLAMMLVSMAAIGMPGTPLVLPLLILALLLLCASAAVAGIGFPRHANEPATGWAGWVGAVLVIGVIAADIGVTVWKSPGLEAEENPFAAVLLDEVRLDAGCVYLLGGIAQLAMVVLLIAFWRNLLARRGWYAARMRSAREQGRALWPAMFGMRDGTLRSWAGRGARADVAAAAAGFYVPAVVAYRAYLAMEWMGWVPYSRVLVPAGLVVAAGAVHVAWARRWAAPVAAKVAGARA